MMMHSKLLRVGGLAGLLLAAAQQTQATVTSYFVRQGMIYQQDSASAPIAVQFTPAEFVARVTGDTASVEGASLLFPQGALLPNDNFNTFGNYAQLSYQVDLQSVKLLGPTGNYIVKLTDGTQGQITFPDGSFPTPVPQVLNFDAAQNIDPAAPFTLNFTPYTGAGANDTYEFEILNSDNSLLFFKSGTGTSVTLPAGTLTAGDSYQANLRFVHSVSSNTTSIPGATGTGGYFNETQINISTTGSGGGGTTGGGTGNDTTPPSLFFTTPSNGATSVPTLSPVVFLFSENMKQQQSIQWSGTGIDPTKFTYSWSSDGQALTATYSGGLPANTTVTWTLQGGATGFQDLAGNSLPAGSTGSFTTAGSGGGTTGGGTGNDNCRSTNNVSSGTGGGSLFKMLEFTQTGNNNPVPDAQSPATAFASYTAASNQTVTAVKVVSPTGTSITLSNLLNFYIAQQDFPSAAAMDALLQPGTYTITATGAGSGTVTVPASSSVPVPKFLNLAELGSFDPTKDFVLNFSPFTGASGFDSISIDITAPNGHHFYAPDYCIPRPLPNTATSVTIPANTFSAGDKLSGSITFSRFSVNSNAIPNTVLSAGAFATTSFDLSGGTTGSGVSFSTPAINPDGTMVITAAVPAGKTLQIQTSTDLKTWTPVGAPLVPVNGTVTYTINPKTITGNRAYFRGIVQ